MRNRKIVFWLFVAILAWLGRDGLRGQVSPDLRMRYLEARLANAEAVARFEQSLSNEQRSWRQEANQQRTVMAQIEQAIFTACIEAGKLPGRKADNQEPACAAPETEVRGGSLSPGSNQNKPGETSSIQPPKKP